MDLDPVKCTCWIQGNKWTARLQGQDQGQQGWLSPSLHYR